MKIVIAILILPIATLIFLPERAWAPPNWYPITEEVISVSVNDNVTGSPWSWIRVKDINLRGSSNDITNPGVDREDGNIRF